MSELRRCSGCGADAPRPEARFCEQCGAELPAETSPTESEPPDPFGHLPDRFRALANHADLQDLLAAKPEVPELAGKVLPSLALLLLLGVGGFFASLLCFQLCPPLGFVPLALVVVSFFALGRQMIWSSRTPLVAQAALIVELRAKLQAGAQHSPAHTRHFVTLEFENGTRVEKECLTSALPSLRKGDLGVAYLKGERVAAFASLPV